MGYPLLRTDKEIAELYETYVDMVYRLCFTILKNRFDTEDAVQNTFIKLMHYSKPFDSPEHEKAWLIVTARNECRDQLKHWWRSRRAATEELDHLIWYPPENSGLWEQVAALPSRDRLILYLYYYQGYSTDEIASLLKEKPGTLRCQLTRARKTLKLRLEADGYGPPQGT